MAEADPLKRVQSAARRAAGPVSVETQRRWYQNDLLHDLGLDPDAKAHKSGRPRQVRFSGARVLTFILLALLACFAVFTAHLAREGRLDFLLYGPESPRPDLSWMGAAKEQAVAIGDAASDAVRETPAPPNLFEPDAPVKREAHKAAPSSEGEPAPDESEAAASEDASEPDPS
jgi:hypothetical protein